MAAATGPGHGPIVFYDGDCGLCQRFVQFVVARDPTGAIRFAPLQGRTAAENLPPHLTRSLNSVVLLDRAGIHQRSDASLRVLARLGGRWSLAGALRIVPRPLRNGIYDVIARHRLGWFGQASVCLRPEPTDPRFLP